MTKTVRYLKTLLIHKLISYLFMSSTSSNKIQRTIKNKQNEISNFLIKTEMQH